MVVAGAWLLGLVVTATVSVLVGMQVAGKRAAAERQAWEAAASATARAAADAAKQEADKARQRAEDEDKAIADAVAEANAKAAAEANAKVTLDANTTTNNIIELSGRGWGEVILFDPKGVVIRDLTFSTKRIPMTNLTETDLLAVLTTERGYKALTELRSPLPRSQASSTLEKQLDELWRNGKDVNDKIQTRLRLLDNLFACNYSIGVSGQFAQTAVAAAQSAAVGATLSAESGAKAQMASDSVRDVVTRSAITGAEISRRPYSPDVQKARKAGKEADAMRGQADARNAQAESMRAQAEAAKRKLDAAKAALAQGGIQIPSDTPWIPTLFARAEVNSLLQAQLAGSGIAAERAAATAKVSKEYFGALRLRAEAQENAPAELAKSNALRRIKLASEAMHRTGFGTQQINRVFAQGGNVTAWGSNRAQERSVPQILSGGVVAIASAGNHSIALRTNGTVVAWGSNKYWESTIPGSLRDVAAIAAGVHHGLALKGDGTVVAWGAGSVGYQGTPHDRQSIVPAELNDVVAIAAGGRHSLALRAGGRVVAWGRNNESQCSVPADLTDVIAISAGENHNLALRRDGRVVAWGKSGENQCNVPPGLSDVIAISAAANHNVALKSDGSVVAWGANSFNQCSVPEGLREVISVATGGTHCIAFKRDGSIVAWGSNGSGQCESAVNLKNIVAISAGENHSLVLTLGDVGRQTVSAEK